MNWKVNSNFFILSRKLLRKVWLQETTENNYYYIFDCISERVIIEYKDPARKNWDKWSPDLTESLNIFTELFLFLFFGIQCKITCRWSNLALFVREGINSLDFPRVFMDFPPVLQLLLQTKISTIWRDFAVFYTRSILFPKVNSAFDSESIFSSNSW